MKLKLTSNSFLRHLISKLELIHPIMQKKWIKHIRACFKFKLIVCPKNGKFKSHKHKYKNSPSPYYGPCCESKGNTNDTCQINHDYEFQHRKARRDKLLWRYQFDLLIIHFYKYDKRKQNISFLVLPYTHPSICISTILFIYWFFWKKDGICLVSGWGGGGRAREKVQLDNSKVTMYMKLLGI